MRGGRTGEARPIAGPDGGGATRKTFMGLAGVRAGTTYVQRDARRLLEGALLLHGKRRFRGAIWLAILSMEESLKGVSMGTLLSERRAMSDREWSDLKSHRHKLVGIPGAIVKGVEGDCGSGVRVHVEREVWSAHLGRQSTARVCVVSNARLAGRLARNLQRVKEACAYEEWGDDGTMRREWDLDAGESEAVSLFALELARAHYEMLRGGVSFALGTLAPECPVPEGGGKGRPGPDARGHDPDKMLTGRMALLRLSDEIDLRGPARGRGARSGSA